MSEIDGQALDQPDTQETGPWKIYGPYFYLDTAAGELGMTVEEVKEMIDGHVLLGLETAHGDVVVPARQFILDEEGNVDISANLPVVLSAWDKEQLDGWTFLATLSSPQTWLDGQTIFDASKDSAQLPGIVEEIEAWMRRLKNAQ